MEGLLHLSAITIVLTAGYLGVDKARHGADELREALTKAKLLAAELVNQLGLGTINETNKKRRPSWRSWTAVYPAWVICIAAEVDVSFGWHVCPHFVYRQKYIPCYKFFSARSDIRMVTWMFAASIAIFLLLVWDSLWGIPPFHSDLDKALIFATLVVILLAVFFLGAVSFRIMNLDHQFEKLKKKVQKRLKDQREAAMKLLADMD